MATDPDPRPETVSTPVHDPALLARAGWTNAELIWEQIQQTAAECERAGEWAEACELWRGALEVARDRLAAGDLRLATSVANDAVAQRRDGDRSGAGRRLEEALALWDAGGPWIESLAPVSRARSSTFHLRLRARHPGGYDRFPRARYRALAAQGRDVLLARRDGRADDADRLARWRRERPEGFDDERKLLGAVLLIAADGPGGRDRGARR